MPQRSVAANYTFEQQRAEINLLAEDFWNHSQAVNTAASTYLKHTGDNAFTGATLDVPNSFTINPDSGNGTLTISGNLNVTGTQTVVNTTILNITDKNITLAAGNTLDANADGAGITIDCPTDKTFTFNNSKVAFVSNIGLEATTFVAAPYGHFKGSGTPTAGMGVEINAPDTNTGQIISFSRDNAQYRDLRIKGSSVGVYTGTSTNTIVGTFNSNGLTLESGKSIGIGDTSGSQSLIIKDADPRILLTETTNNSNCYLDYAAGGVLEISVDDNNVDANSKFQIRIDGQTAGLTLDSTGRLGIGTVAPQRDMVHIHNPDANASNYIQFTNENTGGTGINDGTLIGISQNNSNTDGTGSGFTILNKENAEITLGTNGNERVRITSGGQLHVGNATNNANNNALFKVVADDGEAANLYVGQFKNLEETAGESFGVNIQAGSSADDHGLRVRNRANNATQFIVRGNGRVGIGEEPVTKVGVALAAQVADGTDDGDDWGADGIFQLDATGTAANNNEILFVGAHSGGNAQIASGFGFGRENTSNWGTYLSFKTHSTSTSNIDELTERLRITSGGSAQFKGNGAIFEQTGVNEYNSSWAAANGKIALKGDLGGGNYFGWREKGVGAGSVTQANAEKKLPTINDFTYPNSSSGMLIASTSKIGFAASGESPQFSTGVTMLFDGSGLALGGTRAFDSSDSVSATSDAKIKLFGSQGKIVVGADSTDANTFLHVEAAQETNFTLAGAGPSSVGGIGSYMLLKCTNGTNGTASAIQGIDAGGQGTSEIQFRHENHSNNEGSLRFSTRKSGGSMTERLEINSRGKVSFVGHQDTSVYGASNWAITGSGNQSNTSQATPEGSFQWQSETSKGIEKYKSYIQTTVANQGGMYITITNSSFYRITAKASHNSQSADVGMWLVYGLNNMNARIEQICNTGNFTVTTHNTHVNANDTTLLIDYGAATNQGCTCLVEQIGGF